MKIGLFKESAQGERRVALSPEGVKKALGLGFEVVVERSAGVLSGFSDALYQEAGASLGSFEDVLSSDLIFKVLPPKVREDGKDELGLKPSAALVSLFFAGQNPELLNRAAQSEATFLSLDSVPRISRAQKLDVLSSMSNLGGYRAVVEGAYTLGRFLGGQITAAGRVAPARVLIIGAGVAGLAALGAARSMGAVVRAFDTRKEVKEQIESLGGEFLTVSVSEDTASKDGYAKDASQALLEAELKLFAEEAPKTDILITTALIPGKPAPKLIDEKVLSLMKPGSVVVDLAAERGGNCVATKMNEHVITPNGVHVLGYTDLPSRMASQASSLFSQNMINLLLELCPKKDGVLEIDEKDPMIRNMMVASHGSVMFPPPPLAVSAAPAAPAAVKKEAKAAKEKQSSSLAIVGSSLLVLALAVGMVLVAVYAPEGLFRRLALFILSSFVGYQLIWKVSPSLHTPLMSLTNAVSGVGLFGAMAVTGAVSHTAGVSLWLGLIGVALAAINVYGGLATTTRMLSMYRR